MTISRLLLIVLALALVTAVITLGTKGWAAPVLESPPAAERTRPLATKAARTIPQTGRMEVSTGGIREPATPDSDICRGRVIDDNGEPVARATLGVWRQGSVLRTTSTDSNGTFAVVAPESRDKNYLKILDPGRCESRFMVGPITYGADAISIELQHTESLQIHVVAADSGADVEDYSVRLRPRRDNRAASGNPRFRGYHPNGVALVSGFWRGDNYVCVIPDDASLWPSQVMCVAPSTLNGTLTVKLRRRKTLTVEVVRENGDPVAGCKVQVVAIRGERKLFERGTFFDRHNLPLGPLRAHWTKQPELIAAASTDDSGRAVVGIPHVAYAVTVDSAWLKQRRVIDHDTIRGDRLRVVIPNPGALTLAVKHRFPSTWRWEIAVSNILKGDNSIFAQGKASTTTTFDSRDDGDGPYELPELSPGQYKIYLSRVITKNKSSGGTYMDMASSLVVTIKPDEHHQVTLDVTDFAPITVTGVVTIDGKVAAGTVTLYSGRYPNRSPERSGIPLINGTFRVDEFPVGPCLLALDKSPLHNRPHSLWAPQLSESLDRENNHLQVQFRERTAVFRIKDSSGKPLANTRLFAGISSHRQVYRTNSAGELSVDYVPLGDKSFQIGIYWDKSRGPAISSARMPSKSTRFVTNVQLTDAKILESSLNIKGIDIRDLTPRAR